MLFGLWRLSAVARGLFERLAERVPVIIFLPTAGTEDADGAHAELRAWATSAERRSTAPIKVARTML